MVTTEHIREIITEFWRSNEEDWFRHLARLGWIGMDWPIEYGGTGWSRAEQLDLVKAMAEYRCPLMPDSVSLIAPLVLNHGSTRQKEYYLPRILNSPNDYRFQTSGDTEPRGTEPGCILDVDAGDLFLVSDEGSVNSLGLAGDATLILTTSCSPLWSVYEQLLGLAHLQKMNEYWQETSSTHTETEIEVATLTALFLGETESADQQIRLRVNQDRYDLYASLFQSLGYYALLSPDSTLSSNEPLPFTAEREFLQSLRQQVDRDTMMLKDQLYAQKVGHEET